MLEFHRLVVEAGYVEGGNQKALRAGQSAARTDQPSLEPQTETYDEKITTPASPGSSEG
jgi:hypothetical protein